MTTIVIIDDQFTSREVLSRLVTTLEDRIEVHSFADAITALDWIREHDTDLVLTDYKMPQMDGVTFTRRFRALEHCADVPVIMVTCIEDREVRYEALESGATDFLTKPIDHHECRARVRNLLTMSRQQRIIKDRAHWLERQVDEATRALRIREQETLLRLAKAGEYRDEETGNHVVRMARYSRLIAVALGVPTSECEVIESAAPMHDIGKIGIPDSILLKPGKHTPDEFSVMKQHTLIGYEILKESPSKYLQMGAIIALGHHEKFDGGGYPYGLAGDSIPLPARIVAVADVFDALTSVRPYKRAWSLQDSIDYIRRLRGSHFDPECVDAFMGQLDQIIDIHDRLRDEPVKRFK
ncbi:MAG: response regulator [Gammaproteobacteria bacterium]